MRREQVEIEAPSIGGAGTVIGYGHYGRPVLLFPAEQGRAWDLEGTGMIDAVADLIEAGRAKLYTVDSYDGASWSNRSIPLEDRARAPRRLRGVDRRARGARHPRRPRRRAGDPRRRVQHGRLPRGELRAAPRRPLPRWRCACRAATTPRTGTAGASAATPPTSTTRWTTSSTSAASISTGCARASACCSSAARGSGRTRPALWTSTRAFAALLERKGIRHELDLWGYDVPTTGRHGARSSPTTCRASADARDHTPHRPAARHRGRLAHRLRDHRLAAGADQGRGRLDATASTSSA